MKPDATTKTVERIAEAMLRVALAVVLAVGLSIPTAALTGLGGTVEQAYAQNNLTATSISKALDTQSLTSAKINKKSLTITYGKSKTITVSGAQGKKIKWSTSNSKVAKVKSAGKSKAKITAVKAGKVTITAKIGSKKLRCKVTVTGKLSKSSLTMNAFKTPQLTLKGATAKKWSSSDTAYVEVSKNGKLTAGGMAGTATVTCTDTVGNKYKCKVRVSLPDITCEMVKTQYSQPRYTRYYYKYFTLSNRCGRTIKLQNDALLYTPFFYDDDSNTSEPLIGIANSSGTTRLSESPLTIDSGYYIHFWGFEGTSYYSIYDSGIFAMTLTISNAEYIALFKTNGTLISLSRS